MVDVVAGPPKEQKEQPKQCCPIKLCTAYGRRYFLQGLWLGSPFLWGASRRRLIDSYRLVDIITYFMIQRLWNPTVRMTIKWYDFISWDSFQLRLQLLASAPRPHLYSLSKANCRPEESWDMDQLALLIRKRIIYSYLAEINIRDAFGAQLTQRMAWTGHGGFLSRVFL